MALKRTSEPFSISTSITESGVDTFTEVEVNVNLNPLDQEVLLILAVDLDCFAPDINAALNSAQTLSVSTTSRTAVGSIADANVMAAQRIDIKNDGVSAVALDRLDAVAPVSTNIDYISILATSDFYIQTQGVNNLGAKGGNVRVWCVRAKADAATYAALVQSEQLSA